MKTNDIRKFFKDFKWWNNLQVKFPEANFTDALSWGQLNSKLWLIDELLKLDRDLGIVFLLGGWYGTLAKFMFETPLKIRCIRSFDIDDSCWKIADTINRPSLIDGWKFKAITEDIFKINFEGHEWYGWSNNKQAWTGPVFDVPDTIINTSCEHMGDTWIDKIPKGKLIILQTNDFLEGNGHINCIETKEEMIEKYKLSEVLYIGKLELDKYNRFMLIGIK